MQKDWRDREEVDNVNYPWKESDWKAWFTDLKEEFEYEVPQIDIEGTVPKDLLGTFARQGPGNFNGPAGELVHIIDGDGLLVHVAFKDGRVYFRNKYVETEAYLEEKKAGKLLYKGAFGTTVETGNPLKNIYANYVAPVRNPANTHQIMWGNKILALYEGGVGAYALDPESLITTGMEMFKDSMCDLPEDLSDLSGGSYPFSAHPRFDYKNNLLCNFGLRMAKGKMKAPAFCIWEHDHDYNLVSQSTFEFRDYPERIPIIHAIGASENFVVIHEGPVKIAIIPALKRMVIHDGMDDVILPEEDKGSFIYVVKRTKVKNKEFNKIAWDGGFNVTPVRYRAPCNFIYHHVNQYEENGKIILDSLAFDKFCPLDIHQRGHDDRNGKLTRFVIDPTMPDGSMVERIILCNARTVMPTIKNRMDMQKHRYVYQVLYEPEPYCGIMKVDLKTGETEKYMLKSGRYTQEAIFASRRKENDIYPTEENEDDGWLLNLVFDGRTERSYLQIIDAKKVSQGPICRIHFKTHVPYGFHSIFFDGYMNKNAREQLSSDSIAPVANSKM